MIRAFLSSGLLYEEAQHHNCVFVGRDASGKPRFASQRDWVLVFEAPIDLMSYLTLHRKVTSNAIALCGLYEGALDTYLRDNPHIRRIALCLDADGPGQTAAERLQAKYERMGYTVKIQRQASGKDWNEYLQQCGQIKERRNACQAQNR